MKLLSRWLRRPEPTPQQVVTPPLAEAIQEPPPEPAVPSEEALFLQALERKEPVDPALAARLAVAGTSTRVRQLAAQTITDPADIRRLIKEARGRDKNVYRILREKNAALLEQERRAAQVQAEIAACCAALERHSHLPYDNLYVAALEHLTGQWSALAPEASPEMVTRAEAAIERCRHTITSHIQALASEAAAAQAAQREKELAEQRRREEAAARAAAQEALRAEEQARAEQEAARQLALRRVGGLIAKARRALREGRTAQAAGLRRALERRVSELQPPPAHIVRQVQQLDVELRELKDWKEFAVAPKRIELIESMEKLIAAELPPRELARRIRELQEAWRTTSKGAAIDEDDAEWQRFHQAAQAAFEPCRAYFAEQARIRQENLDKRAALVERLRTYEAEQNWEQADWKAVGRELSAAENEWRSHFPVERQAAREVQRQYEEVMGRLRARLEAEYARNIKERRSLIARAQRLLSEPDGRKALDELKRLQQKWKESGPVPRAEDRKLWEEFRAQCDALHEQRRKHQAERAAQLQARIDEATALCEEAERLAGLDGASLAEGQSRLQELRNAFAAIEDLPRAEGNRLHQRFERAYEQCMAALARHRARQEEQGWSDLLAAADRIRQWELAVLGNVPEPQCAELRQAAGEYIAKIARWPKGSKQVIEERLARDPAACPELAANESVLRKLCIRAELATDSPTPEEDLQLRREYQVQRLVQAMGQGASRSREELDALTLEWVAAGPVPDEVHARLVGRLRACRAKACTG